MTTSTILAGRLLFATEIAAARRLGFELQFLVEPDAAFARAQPVTARARAACRRATGTPNQAVQAHCHYSDDADVPDALRQAIGAALDLARAAVA